MKIIKNWIYPILIIMICVFLAWKNYVPNTILSGWDTLHPEFNFWLYLRRSLNGVWMEHQGLGAVASQAHPAEISRLFVVGLLNLLLPQNLVRYTFFFLSLTTGVLGIYFFTKHLLSLRLQKYVQASAFLASLFYLFNLTTVQQFYVPLEMFAVHYALVPWLFLLASKYINKSNNNLLFWFGIITFFASSMAHTATLFYVYLLCLGLYTFLLNCKKSFVLMAITILINLFWLLPNLYFIKNHSQEVSNSKIHSTFTGEAALQSEVFGTFKDLALSKNFLFNWQDYNFSNNQFVDLLGVWKNHLNKPFVIQIGFILFGISIFGFLVSIFRKSKYSALLFPVFLISIFFWINSNPPFETIFDYFKNNINLFREGLRFPFTKFSIILIMILSIWFSFASQLIFSILGKIKLSFIYFLIIILFLIYFQFPQLQGNLINKSMLVKIPNEYSEMFNWFDKQDYSARVARLPLNTYWGWQYNDWGYQGAGFDWFGIKQPILEREFDRWSSFNETFYLQASNALYNNDNETFKKVLEKYQVKYLVLDESIIDAGGDKDLLRLTDIKNTLSNLKINEVARFGFLTIYDTNIASNNFVSAVNNYSLVNADLNYSLVDPIYSKYRDYVQSEDGIGYPFVNFDKRGLVNIKIINNELLITNKSTNSEVQLPIDGKTSETFASDRGFNETFNCDLMKKGEVQRQQLEIGRSYKAMDGGVSCDYFSYTDLTYDKAYILRVKGNNLDGRSLKIYLYNWETQRVELEELMPTGKFDEYFVIYSKDSKEGGYTLNVETRSFGRISSENEVNLIEIVPFDINLISNLYIDPKVDLLKTGNLEIKDVIKYGTSIYKVQVKGEGLLVLNQSFEKGWISYPRLEHVKVNSWANGFVINIKRSEQKIK
ncbi:MAG: hypothetical protein UR21_C0021G0001, partial [Candidatus Woesebacteria bacterium GW2011_GWC2_31_9]